MSDLSVEVYAFPGLYGSLLDPNEIFSEDDDIGVVPFDFSLYASAVGKAYTKAIAADMPALDMTFEAIDSPREYNYGTDRLFVTISRNGLDQAESYAQKNLKAFSAFLTARHAARPGFSPFYSIEPADRWGSDDPVHQADIVNFMLTAELDMADYAYAAYERISDTSPWDYLPPQ